VTYSALVGDYSDFPANFIPFSTKSRVKKWYWISPDSNGQGVNACYFGGGESLNLLQIAVGNYITDEFDIQMYLDMSALPNVKFLGIVP
jgi:hypothetical protein